MDGLNLRREVLTLLVRQPDWQPLVDSPQAKILEELEAMEWVLLTKEDDAYRCELTERGFERHRLWGDERRLRPRSTVENADHSEQDLDERRAA